MNGWTRRGVGLAIAATLLLGGCSGDSAEDVSASGSPAEVTGVPLPCGVEAPSATWPDGKPASTTSAIPVATLPEKELQASLAVAQRDPLVEKALGSGARLAWAQPWTVADDAVRGTLLQYEFTEPVALPTTYGEPLRGEGDEPGDQYGKDGLPLLGDPRFPEQYSKALSATIAIDLDEGRIYYLRASDEHFYC